MAIRALFQSLYANRFARRVALAVLIISLLLGGVQLRRWTWAETRHVRFQHDIVNAFYWGSETLAEARRLSPDEASANSWTAFVRGYFALYDRVKRKAYENDYRLDYPPLRLLVMSIWARQVRSDFPEVDDGHPKHLKPLLNANLACELISAVAIFLLVRLWVHRASGATGSRFLHRVPAESRAWICGLAAASVAWLEPSMILDTHGWPQWDVWILPFYLFAALAASTKRWFLCGCLLAAGAMLKGQLLVVAPFFVLWPLWQKRWTRALRFARGVCVDDRPGGFALAFAHSNGVDRGRACWWRQLFDFFRPKVSARLGVGGRYDCSGSVRRRSARWGQLCMAANWFSLRQRALPISLHPLVLQLAIPSRPSRLVVKRFVVVVRIRVAIYRRNPTVDVAPGLSRRARSLLPWRRPAFAQSRSPAVNCDCDSVALDVRVARSNARALPGVGRSRERGGARCQPEIERGPLHHFGDEHGHDRPRDVNRQKTRNHARRCRPAPQRATICLRPLAGLCGSLSVGHYFNACSRIPATAETIPPRRNACFVTRTGA